MSPYAVYLYHQEACFQKQQLLLYKPFHLFFHRNRLSLGDFLTYLGHPGQFVHSDPLNVETSYPEKINLFGRCENAVFKLNANAIFKNRAVPTNPFISQHLLILDY